jgi:hypothetical protein
MISTPHSAAAATISARSDGAGGRRRNRDRLRRLARRTQEALEACRLDPEQEARLALNFGTWRALAREQGLTGEQAVDLTLRPTCPDAQAV